MTDRTLKAWKIMEEPWDSTPSSSLRTVGYVMGVQNTGTEIHDYLDKKYGKDTLSRRLVSYHEIHITQLSPEEL